MRSCGARWLKRAALLGTCVGAIVRGDGARAGDPLDACLIGGVYFPEPKIRAFASRGDAMASLGVAADRVRWFAGESVFLARRSLGLVSEERVRVLMELDEALPMDDPELGVASLLVTSVSVGTQHVVVRLLDKQGGDEVQGSPGSARDQEHEATRAPTWTLLLVDRSSAQILGALRYSDLGGSAARPRGRIAVDNDTVTFEDERGSARIALTTLEHCAVGPGETRQRASAHARAGREALEAAPRLTGVLRTAALMRARDHFRLANALSTRVASLAGFALAEAELALDRPVRDSRAESELLMRVADALEDAKELSRGLRQRLYLAATRLGLKVASGLEGAPRRAQVAGVRRWLEAAKQFGKIAEQGELEAAVTAAERVL